MNEQPKLVTPGIHNADTVTAEAVPTWQLAVSSADDLQRLNQDYAFYSPALLYLYVALGNDPIHHYYKEHPEAKQFQLQFDKPIFEGMRSDTGETAWNHWLHGIDRAHWDDFAGYMGSLAIKDTGRKLFVRLRPREVRVPDPLWLAKRAVADTCPTVPITVWCLDTNRGCVWVEGAESSAGLSAAGTIPISEAVGKPIVKRSKAVLPETLKFAEACWAGSADPYGNTVSQEKK